MSKQKRRVLIVDDNESDRHLFTLFLKRDETYRYKIHEASSLDTILEKLQECEYDCIMLDYNLADCTAVDIIKKIKDLPDFRPPPIVVLTGEGSEEIAVELMKMGIDDYLIKGGVNKEVLTSTLNRVIEKERLRKIVEVQNKEKEELLAIVSHDLKNPLSVIEASADLIIQDQLHKDPKALNDLLNRIKRNSQNCLELVLNLLDQSKLENEITLDRSRFKIDELIIECYENLKGKFEEKSIKVDLDLKDNIYIKADYGRLAQVISNILGNAIKFTSYNETVKILSETFTAEGAGDKYREQIKITFINKGISIPENKLSAIFRKFDQASEADKKIGAGLGLYISKKICDLHKGHIWAENLSSDEVAFHVLLPARKDRVLIVDDSEDARNIMKQYLRELDMNYLETENGQEAMSVLKKQKIDMIILDLEMPIMNGFEVIEEIKKDNFLLEIPIIVYSSLEKVEELDKISDSVNGYLHKPASKESFSKIVLEKLRYDSHLSDKKQILIVNHDETIRKLLAEKIEEANMSAITAKNGLEGLLKCKIEQIDAVVADIQMPVMSGKVMIERIKKIVPEMPIVLINTPVFDPQISMANLITAKVNTFSMDNDIVGILNKIFCPEGQDCSSSINIMKVLAVDDSLDHLKILELYLKKYVKSFDMANSGKEALKKIKKNQYDIILMDIEMDDMDGIETSKQIKKIGVSTPIIGLTAHSDSKCEEILRKGIMKGIAQKPIDQKSLIDIIKKKGEI